MQQLCRDYGVQEPVLRIEDNWVTIVFNRDDVQSGNESVVTPSVTPPVERVIFFCEQEIEREKLKPNSPLQWYRLTERGRQWLSKKQSGR